MRLFFVVTILATSTITAYANDGETPPVALPPISMPPDAEIAAFFQPPIVQPPVVAPTEIPAEPLAPPSGEPLGNTFTLDELVSVLLSNHPKLRQAAAEVDKARGAAIQAGLYPNPTFDSGSPQAQLAGSQSIYQGGFTQVIVRGGKLRLSQASAEQHVAAMQMQYLSQRMYLITDLRKLFLTVLAQQHRIDLLRTLVGGAEQSEIASENLMKAGEVGLSDVLLIRIERRRAQALYEAEQRLLAGNLRQLAVAVAVPDLNIDRVIGELNLQIPGLEDNELVRRVTTMNPQVRQVRYEIDRSRLALQRAVAEPIPNVSIQSGMIATPNQPHIQGLAGAYFTIPIWDRNQGNIRAARADIGSTTAQYAGTQFDLYRQLADALARYRAADELLRVYETGILPDTEESIALVRDGYQRGQFDILRLLQAQRSYIETHLIYIDAQRDRSSSAAEILGLLQIETSP